MYEAEAGEESTDVKIEINVFHFALISVPSSCPDPWLGFLTLLLCLLLLLLRLLFLLMSTLADSLSSFSFCFTFYTSTLDSVP